LAPPRSSKRSWRARRRWRSPEDGAPADEGGTMEAKAHGRDRRQWTFQGRSRARPEQVYEVLADLRSHLEWAGNRQFRSFRLLSLDTPSGPAEPGTQFTSTGRIPMSRARFDNRNTVTKANRTGSSRSRRDRRSPGPSGPRARAASSTRSRSHRTVTGVAWSIGRNSSGSGTRRGGLRYPLLRTVTARVWIPIWSRRGFRNLLRMAEERSARGSDTAHR
jgi:hypothetical protein